MGLFSSLLKLAVPIAGAIVPGIKPVLAAAGLGAAFGVAETVAGEVVGTPPPSPLALITQPAAPILRTPLAVAQAAAGPLTAAQTAAARRVSLDLPGAPRGRGQVVTQTIVERRTPEGVFISATALKGSPFLMKSEIASLKRTLRLIQMANKRVPKRTKQPSEKAVDKRVEQVARTGNFFRLLTDSHHNHGKC